MSACKKKKYFFEEEIKADISKGEKYQKKVKHVKHPSGNEFKRSI